MLSIISTLSTLGSALLLSMASCGQGEGSGNPGSDSAAILKSQAHLSEIAYDLENPTIYTLPSELREVSGIAFYKGDPALLYAEQDEKGRLYWLAPGDKEARHYDFGKDGDYEDLAFIAGQVVYLKSNGNLYGFDFAPGNSPDEAPVTGKLAQWKDVLPKGEYEGMYGDDANQQLYVLCKECKNEDHKKSVSVYQLGRKGQLWAKSGTFKVDVTKISALYDALPEGQGKKKKKINFKPSALSLNKLTHEWYILSSINKMLVVTDMDWQVKAVYTLNSKLYPQPEGMCFDRDNNLYISNEGPDGKMGTLLKFALKAR